MKTFNNWRDGETITRLDLQKAVSDFYLHAYPSFVVLGRLSMVGYVASLPRSVTLALQKGEDSMRAMRWAFRHPLLWQEWQLQNHAIWRANLIRDRAITEEFMQRVWKPIEDKKKHALAERLLLTRAQKLRD